MSSELSELYNQKTFLQHDKCCKEIMSTTDTQLLEAGFKARLKKLSENFDLENKSIVS